MGIEGVLTRQRHIGLCRDYWPEVQLAAERMRSLATGAVQPQLLAAARELSSLWGAAVESGLPSLVDQLVPDFGEVQASRGAVMRAGDGAARLPGMGLHGRPLIHNAHLWLPRPLLLSFPLLPACSTLAAVWSRGCTWGRGTRLPTWRCRTLRRVC